MGVDFNNLKKQIAYSLDRVIKTLNNGIMPETEYCIHEISDGEMKHWEGDVLVDKTEIQRDIDELRDDVVVLICTYEKNNPNHQLVYDEVKASGGVARFNEQLEDNEV
jgi:hypothetical protein